VSLPDALVIQHLSAARGGRPVLEDVSLTIPRGEVTALLGANGAGKSTLVLAIARAVPVLRGRIVVDGRDVTKARVEQMRSAGVAVVPEGHRVLSGLTVHENLSVAGARLDAQTLRQSISAALALFPELGDRLQQRAGTLSGGQQQMLAIAQACVGLPRYLLLDELSLGLAPAVVSRLMPVVSEFAERGMGVLLIEQFAAAALDLATTAAVLDRGRIVFTGAADELSQRPDILHSAYLSSLAAH
jgi:branched-chain amino acid transport system ATP-binding protein